MFFNEANIPIDRPPLDVDPNELLRLNGLAGDQNFYAGMVLSIPETPNGFPGERQLRTHPSIYTVSSSTETLYTIACLYGDISPESIAQANQILVDSSLLVGQALKIP
jgi:LysM repeat protein